METMEVIENGKTRPIVVKSCIPGLETTAKLLQQLTRGSPPILVSETLLEGEECCLQILIASQDMFVFP